MLVRALSRPIVNPLVRGVARRERGGLLLGPELLVNGDFSAGATSWAVNNEDSTHIVTFTGGVMRFQSGATSPQLNVQQAGVLVVGRKYLVGWEVFAYVSGALKTDMAAGLVFATAPGAYSYRVTATSTTFNMTRSTANVDISVDKVSIREILSGA